ncbi:MAG: UDP-N-acetyl-D-mannosamine dehydrogenase, partial [Chloroflexi bacterium]|nr:UDP-N-acetyl-D-mannosamine dehydrogenase [Chloroflexota bacterium]
AWEPFKPDASLPGVCMASSLEDAIAGADALLLLVNHSEFRKLSPAEIALKTEARLLVDTVNGWERGQWENAGFAFFRLGDGKSKSVTLES